MLLHSNNAFTHRGVKPRNWLPAGSSQQHAKEFRGNQAFLPFFKFIHPKFRRWGHFFLKHLLTLFSHKPKSILQVQLRWFQKRVYIEEEEHWIKYIKYKYKLAGSHWEMAPVGAGTEKGFEFPSISGTAVSILCLWGLSPQETGYLGYSVGCKISVTLTLPFLSPLWSQACLTQHRVLCGLAASRAASQGWWCQLRSSEDLTQCPAAFNNLQHSKF